MSRKRKPARPSTPMEIARRRAAERLADRDPARWGIDAQALTLAANADVERRPGADGRAARVRRQDVFDLLAARGKLRPEALDAVRRLQNDIAALHRTLTGGGDFSPRIDRSRAPDAFSEARRRAGGRIEAALALAGASSARLLAALCEPEMILGRGADWRAVVARETGESLPDAQGALLRAACENLAGAYVTLDRAKARATRVAAP